MYSIDYAKTEQKAVAQYLSNTKIVKGVPMMSHVQIGMLTGSRPDNVKASMNTLQKDGLIVLTEIQEEPKDSLGRIHTTTVYYVNERDSHIVVARLSPSYTAYLVDFWMANRNQVQPKVPQTYAEALRVAADLSEENQRIAIERDKAVEGRDKAVKEKAWISEKREKTAMVTASKAVREKKKLEEQMGLNGNYRTVRAIPWLKKCFDLKSDGRVWIAIGLRLKRLSEALGYDVLRVEDARWGRVNMLTVTR